MTKGGAVATSRCPRTLSYRSISISALLLLLLLLLLDDRCCCGLKPQHAPLFEHRQVSGLMLKSSVDDCCNTKFNGPRRKMFRQMLDAAMATALVTSSPSMSIATSTTTSKNDINLRHPFVYSDTWRGTSMGILSLEDATKSGGYTRDSNSGLCSWNMGKWPDPALRIPARPIDSALWTSSEEKLKQLQLAAAILRDTARLEGAVGLAAQQCGVDARMIFLSGLDGGRFGNSNINLDDLVLVNPRIVARSEESKMKVWTEECLVLPPTFRATVLRDEWIDVEYDCAFKYRSQRNKNVMQILEPSLSVKQVFYPGGSVTRFVKEQSRCLQHELDHDRGILITDHVGFDEMENDVMRQIEAKGHGNRQALAYSRQ